MTADLDRELKRRHRRLTAAIWLAVLASALAISAAAFLVFLRGDMKLDLDVWQARQQRYGFGPQLKELVDSEATLYIVAMNQGQLITSPGVRVDDRLRALLQEKAAQRAQLSLEVYPIDGHLRLVFLRGDGEHAWLLARRHRHLLGQIVLYSVLILSGSIFLLYLARGGRYLFGPVLEEVVFQRELNRAKELFFAGIFHELGTPLTSMMSRLELMLEQEQPKREDLELTYLEAQRISRLTSDQLQRARFEAGVEQIHRSKVTLEDLFEALLLRLDLLFHHHGVTAEWALHGVQELDADRFALEQALTNLIVNALRHAPGTQSLKLEASRREDKVIIEVIDQGQGFELDRLEELVQPFERDGTRRGSGLGLYLVSRTMALHGGSLSYRRDEAGFAAVLSFPDERVTLSGYRQNIIAS